jgi:hypothetical protein
MSAFTVTCSLKQPNDELKPSMVAKPGDNDAGSDGSPAVGRILLTSFIDTLVDICIQS